ncbi:MAG: lipoprotein insertase outer membrane protein LolB [Arsenophonus endosymbiont of Ceratovacuna japonica]
MIFLNKKFINLRYNYWFFLLFIIFSSVCTLNKQLILEKKDLIINKLWMDHKKQLYKLTKFQIRGSLSYIDINNKIYVKLFWKQNTKFDYHILLTNILGITEFDLNVSPKITKLICGEIKKYFTKNISQIMYQLTGITMPIENMPYWLIGLPINSISFTLYKNGLLRTIEYKKKITTWNLKYFAYYNNNKIKLPSIIELTQGKKHIILKIDNWILN